MSDLRKKLEDNFIDFCKNNNLTILVSDTIQHGVRYTLLGNTKVLFYNTGSIVVQGVDANKVKKQMEGSCEFYGFIK